MLFEERYYRKELDYLRQAGKLLAKDKPHLARFLADKGADPDVERLLEGFALLAGNLRAKIDDEFPEVTHSLINMLWPNYLRPTPSMTIIEYEPDTRKIDTPVLIARGAQMMNGEGSYPFAPGNDDDSTLQPPCIFTLCRDNWLLPVTVENITLHNNQQQGCIEIAFFAENGINPGRTDFNKLRFWLGDEDEYTRNQLYLWLSEYLADAEFVTEGDSVRLPDFALEQVGFSKQDALLPWPGNVYSGYRILQEYLCFKDAFFFFNVQGIHSLPVTDKDVNRFTLRLHFSRPLPLDTRIRKTSLRLYYAPAINLFSCESEPIAIVDSREEYPLRASYLHSESYDIFSVDSVESSRRAENKYGKARQPVSSRRYPAFESFQHQIEFARNRETIYYRIRTESSLFHSGFDHSLSFVLADNTPPASWNTQEVVSVSLTCTNRNLPEKLHSGDISLSAEKNAAVVSFRNITRPTPSLYPVLDGRLHWQLLSSMSLNYLSLLNKDALKQVLCIYDLPGIHNPQTAHLSRQKLDAIERIDTRPVDYLFKGVPVRSLTSTLYIRAEPFACEGEIYLLGTVLSHFFSLYASVNSFHELKIMNMDNQECYEWPERTGQHTLI
ncbi:type VI secretion system baseplate subunit TssF [Escherichia fergusonii]|uniref:type VI secretion system baseplate subunit TssF n=1 Tax=Escherichia fergusonii TaxID=564 RepID=UPI0015E902C4|nr:type VI secretion system baseplate subunit TssF [Escherichia fergusonii]QME84856.1 type VI secretion system baseplate subunit TssF [Escherichia fergusonii]QME94009.1 type VI secretion system baseplate subunit TssF [Escherichia fergusonii]